MSGSYKGYDGWTTRDNMEPVQVITKVQTRAEQVRELEYADHRPVVILSRSILESIKRMRNGLEDSAWLIGPRQEGSRVLEANRSVWPAFDEDRSVSSVQMHYEEAEHIDEALHSNRQQVIGHWHVQPDSSLPSDADFQTWRDLRRHLGLDAFLGVVARERLTGPVDVRAFVIDQDDVIHAGLIQWRS